MLSAVGPVQSASAVTPAPPLASVEIVKKTATVKDFQRVTVYCPGTKYAIGGGAEATASAYSHDSMGLVGSFPDTFPGQAKAFGWVANARNFSGQPTTVTVWAVCAATPQGYELVQAPVVQVPNGQPVTVSCPAGKTVLGGGGEIQGEYTALAKSFPKAPAPGQPTQWVVTGTHLDNGSVGVAAYAMCADPIASSYWAMYTATKPNPSGGFLTCQTGEYVTGGGASSNSRGSVLIAARPGLASEGAIRDGWWVQAGAPIDDPYATDLYVMCSTR
ncbi:hypothetical protein R6L23_34565 [Streptomyces sp. SR27]|uniref:hypothetical protein n=1 Tax=Streptomyces sp. SR27 TaxID=3076630 RepID=UPI00295B9797|nr:hypothetical protein [Streptomyces sp. SR27]MDV9193276.1 hypothetical protein [Streptomyces sp. SR27]